MKSLPSFLLGYGAGIGTLFLIPGLRAVALNVTAVLLRRVETGLARAEARRGHSALPSPDAVYPAPKRERNMPTRSSSSSTSST